MVIGCLLFSRNGPAPREISEKQDALAEQLGAPEGGRTEGGDAEGREFPQKFK